jgi:5-methylcytosine-specific restriction endonuclease McrA
MFKKSRWLEDIRYREYQQRYHKKYRKDNRDYFFNYLKNWKIQNPKLVLEYRTLLLYNLTLEQYKKITEKCYICGFRELVHCHHIVPKSQGGKDTINNYIGLCPNHHFLVHFKKYKLIKLNGKYKLTFSGESEKVNSPINKKHYEDDIHGR